MSGGFFTSSVTACERRGAHASVFDLMATMRTKVPCKRVITCRVQLAARIVNQYCMNPWCTVLDIAPHNDIVYT